VPIYPLLKAPYILYNEQHIHPYTSYRNTHNHPESLLWGIYRHHRQQAGNLRPHSTIYLLNYPEQLSQSGLSIEQVCPSATLSLLKSGVILSLGDISLIASLFTVNLIASAAASVRR
jgi:hypothetical protein